jgi:hypothetical protein
MRNIFAAIAVFVLAALPGLAAATEIDNSAFPRLGNMTYGSGLAGIFDGVPGTTGYREASTAWAGLDMTADPQSIGSIEVVSATNGFDASGLTTSITLTVTGVDTSGTTVALGSQSFTDVNATTTRVFNLPTQGPFREIRVSWQTGVWSVGAEVRIFEPAGPPPTPVLSTKDTAVYLKNVATSVPLPWTGVILPEFTTEFAIEAGSVAEVTFYADTAHVGNTFSPAYLGAIGVGFVLHYRCDDTYPGVLGKVWSTMPAPSTVGFNIDERNPAHYGNAAIVTAFEATETGFCQVGVLGTAHTDGDSRDGLATTNGPYNGLRVVVHKNSELVRQ